LRVRRQGKMGVSCCHRQSRDLKMVELNPQAFPKQYNQHLNQSPLPSTNRTTPYSSQTLPHLTILMTIILKLNLNLSSPAPSKSKGDRRSG
jgi:hypothetical protein